SGTQAITGHWGRGAHMKRDESEKCSTNSIGLLRCTALTFAVFCGYEKRQGHRGLSTTSLTLWYIYSHQHFSRIPSERHGSRIIPYANACCPTSQSRCPAGARHLSGPLRAPVSPLHQPGERGALPHRSAHGAGAEELRHHRCGGGRHLDRMLTIFID